MWRRTPLCFFSSVRQQHRALCFVFCEESCSISANCSLFFPPTQHILPRQKAQLLSPALFFPVSSFPLLPAAIPTTAMCHVAPKARPLGPPPVSLTAHATRQQEDLHFWCHLVPQVRQWSSFSPSLSGDPSTISCPRAPVFWHQHAPRRCCAIH